MSKTLKMVAGLRQADIRWRKMRNVESMAIMEIQGMKTITFTVGLPAELITGW